MQTDPFSVLVHIYVWHSDLLKWATSLKMSSQTKQLKTNKMNNKSKFARTGKLTELIDNNFGIIREEENVYCTLCQYKI